MHRRPVRAHKDAAADVGGDSKRTGQTKGHVTSLIPNIDRRNLTRQVTEVK